MDIQEPKPSLPSTRITTKLVPFETAAAAARAAETDGPADPKQGLATPGASRPAADFRSQMALENASATAPGAISEFRRQLMTEAGAAGADVGISDFRRQLQGEDRAAGIDSGISEFRRQLLEEGASSRVSPAPAPVAPPVSPVAPPPAAPAPALPLEPPPALPQESHLERVREALGKDPQAQADLDKLERSGLLGAHDKDRSGTLLAHLATIATQPMSAASGIDRRRLLADLVHDVTATAGKGLEPLPPRQAAIAAGEDYLLRAAPAEYARLVAGLASVGGKEALHVAGTIGHPADFKAPRTGSLASSLFEQAFASKTNPTAAGDHFARRFAAVLAAAGADQEARARLGRLLVDGALSSADARGRTTLERLEMLADPDRKIDPRLAQGVPDRAKLVRDLLEAIDPAAGQRDGIPVDPRRLFARSSPAEYARVVTELLLTGEASLRPQAHSDVEVGAADVAARLALADPPTDTSEFVTSGRFMEPGPDVAFAERIARLRAALDGRPDAQTALDLLALRLQRDDDRPLHPERGIHLEDLDRLLALADPATPIAEGIDRQEFLASLIEGMATPSAEIDQGDWQTCTVTTLQRMMVEWQPAEYIRMMTELASPEGKTRLARRVGDGHAWELSGAEIARPADWDASAGTDGRDLASRLFQATLMHHAVQGENLATYRQAGFRATEAQADTYDNATDTWTDAFGDPHRGMNAEMLNRLAAELKGDAAFHVEIPATVREILARPDFDAAPILQAVFKSLAAVKANEAKTWNVPVTLALTYPGGRQQLHEVLLTTMSDGPPPTATIVDPQDGKSKQIPLAALGKSIRAVSVPDDAAERLPSLLPFIPAIAAVAGTTLQAGGTNVQDLLVTLMPVMLSYLSGGQVFASQTVASGLPGEAPPGSPSPEQLAEIASALPAADTPGRFALDVLARSGMLDQRTADGRALLGALRLEAAADPEGFSAAIRDLAFGPLDGAGFENEGDAGGGRGRRFVEDAGGGRGRRFIEDAGGGRGRRFVEDAGGGRGRRFVEDAGGGRGRRFVEDAGTGGQGLAGEFSD